MSFGGIFAYALLSAAAFAQSTGAISGTVTAAVDGGALAKAGIQARNTSSGMIYSARSAADGSYTLPALPAGTYEISAELAAMLPFMQTGVAVRPGETARLDIHLQDFQLNTLGESRVDYNGSARNPAPTGPTPRLSDGKPDLSGVWHAFLVTDPGKPDPLPWAQAIQIKRIENNHIDGNHARCLPNGIALTGIFYDLRLIQAPGLIVILHELGLDLPRQVFMDGRPHPPDPEPTWYGHSIGTWDGDTLVIDSVGFNGKIWADLSGLPTTEKLHVIERFRRPDRGHLELALTIDDPGAYAKPWTMKKATTLAPGEELMEYVCEENNRDLQHLVGK